MAYVTVPKDLTKVKSKVVFGLTKRQLLCFGGALLVRHPAFFIDSGTRPHQRGGASHGVCHAAGLSHGAV